MIRDDATQAQVTAARPDTSTWLGANAGSGKTRVLTDRVARLLLEDVPPERILCLTYTKAAASEMQNRLFERLGAWAMMPDDILRSALTDLGITQLPELTKARALFAQAIEAPGGLKIQTIHAFCAAILRRFPLEAGVAPQFQEVEDRAAELLRARLVQDMADGSEASVVAGLAQHMSDQDFGTITQALASEREAFFPPVTPEALRTALGLPQDHGPDWIWGDVFEPDDRLLLHQFVGILHGQSPTMVTLAEALEAFGLDRAPTVLGPFLASHLLTKDLRPNSRTPTKKTRDAMGANWAQMAALIDRLAIAAKRPFLISTYQKSCDLHDFAQVFLPRYAAAKAARGWLDFDDLILKTRDLLANDKVAAWVLYRLDGGIDHILVDEAQDTSPVQWQVIEYLAQEFTSGAGARSDVARTIFVVGDKKQSIYSFQGADPSGFDRMRDVFHSKLEALSAPFQDAALAFSFRSAEAILKLVDLTFAHRAASGFSPEAAHRAFHGEMGGRVDLWPVVPKPASPAAREWTDVVDRPDPADAKVVLATTIAQEITRLLSAESLPVKDPLTGHWVGRKIEPKDILILVENRSGIFPEIIRACKKAGLPMAGADVLKVAAELAVRDLRALLAWLALPEDDLALATALRSPLFGWSEQELYTLCYGREEPFLWRTLEARRDTHAETWGVLQDLRDTADFARPYDLLERILIRHGGRAALLARLGAEAEDGINALLDQAIAYESSETPSLTGFVLWIETDDLKIKRQPDIASNQIRVMTVHGAKGLEAPIVILPDCAKSDKSFKGLTLSLDGIPVMAPKSGEMPEVLAPIRAEMVERMAQERDRLLYVAMTRAENWLIVAAAGDLGKDGRAWHDQVRVAMEHAGAAAQNYEGVGDGLRFETGHWPATPQHQPSEDTPREKPLPHWLSQPAPTRITPLAPLNPSGLGGAKALPGAGQDEDAALAHGTQVHEWLEHLSNGSAAPPSSDAAFNEALRVFQHPDFAFLFGSDALSEVVLTAPLPSGARLRGAIDRLCVTEACIWAVDYKTNHVVPTQPSAVPEGLLRQMGAYAAGLREIYPDREIRTALLWTRTPSLMVLPHDLVTEAFHRATAP